MVNVNWNLSPLLPVTLGWESKVLPSSDVALMVTVPPGCPALTVMTPVDASMVMLDAVTEPFSTDHFTPVALPGVAVALIVDR